jgi:hypothetical protein
MATNVNVREQLLEVAKLSALNKLKKDSREGYDCKIKYIIKFIEQNYPDWIIVNEENGRIKELKIPLPFESIKTLFAQLQIDVDLPKSSKKRKKKESERILELEKIRTAILERGGNEETDIPERLKNSFITVDNTPNKLNSITASKSCLQGYKSALKTYYSDREMAFECPDLPVGKKSLDKYLNEEIKSYGNLIADKKKRAVMPVTEGKDAMTEEGFSRIIDKLIKYKPTNRYDQNGRVIIILY